MMGNPRISNRPVLFLLVGIFLALHAGGHAGQGWAAQEILKTAKVRVGETVPLTGSLKEAHEAGKAIVLVFLPNPIQCQHCEQLTTLLEEEAAAGNPGDVAYLVKGGQDMLGAVDEETVTLKKSFGFVTIGTPWTFVIDREGVLITIWIGSYTRQELQEMLMRTRERE
ncbi:MAG: hypothetical protein HY760_04490 [Nitrospirae bacterium]|nr:hypothetical protein [Nitrospirota bacterium]